MAHGASRYKKSRAKMRWKVRTKKKKKKEKKKKKKKKCGRKREPDVYKRKEER
ncbi:hypothetical protein PFAG_03567 [Plasmodium falciparum Santa Lucia]|uniref:60S ribosomal protein L41 n=1 Tax=Plasmodium falciparum Santa Lucia TaxID=478859 RepID=W7G3H9_PLAFA|nr:hypothetical protein PFAG_03567 [Plasmodium falciparum Santa Lucia]